MRVDVQCDATRRRLNSKDLVDDSPGLEPIGASDCRPGSETVEFLDRIVKEYINSKQAMQLLERSAHKSSQHRRAIVCRNIKY